MNLIQPYFWRKKYFISFLLLPIAAIYWLLMKFKNVFIRAKKLPATTIVVGNVTIGGAGKTPTSLKIAQLLKNKSRKLAFVTRGYKGSLVGPVLLQKSHKVKETGDEAQLLVQNAQVIIAKDKNKSARLIKENNIDLVILDDGLQNNSIKYDIKILVIDAKYQFGNNFIFPAGPLRDGKRKYLKQADFIISIGKGELIEQYKEKSYKAKYQSISSHNKKKQYFAFSALAKNQKFFDSLKEYGLDVVATKEFPDHYHYKNSEIKALINQAKKENLSLITTSKDYVKLSDIYKKEIEEFKIELIIENQEKLIEELEKLCQEKK